MLNATTVRVLAVADSDDFSVTELVDAIEDDEGLSANLLRLANSAAMVRPMDAHTVRQAVTMVGRKGVRRLTLEATTYRFLESAPGNGRASRGQMHLHAMAVSRVAAGLAERAGYPGESVHLAGLLHDIGKLVLPLAFGEEPVEDLALGHPAGAARVAAERERFGVDHAAAGALLGHAWGLPAEVNEAIAAHHGGPDGEHSPNATCAAVQLANAVSGMIDDVEASPALTLAALEVLALPGSALDEDAEDAALIGEQADEEGSLANRVDGLARTDDLIGVANRRYWTAATDEALAEGTRGTVLLCDIDALSNVNDRFGQRSGDLVLTEVALVLARHGHTCRVDGDVFAVWVPGARSEGERIASVIPEDVRATLMNGGDGRHGPLVNMSIGAAVAPGDAKGASELLDQADQALRTVKQQRRPGS